MDRKTRDLDSFERATATLPLSALDGLPPDQTINAHRLAEAVNKTRTADTPPPITPPVSAEGLLHTPWDHEGHDHLRSVVAEEDVSAKTGGDLIVGALIGKGGMAQVRLGEQTCLAREVAVKMPYSEEHRATRLQTLVREAMVMGRIEHPNTVPVHQLCFNDREQPIIVMKRISGTDWRTLAQKPDHPTWGALRDDPEAQQIRHLEIVMQVCHVVSYAHNKGFLHRDIKPENVMIGDFGEVYLLDWGIALEMGGPPSPGAGDLMGTPAYMAPEMIGGDSETLDPRTDVYLLGSSLYEALTGRLPHVGSSLISTLVTAFEKDHLVVDDPGLPEELVNIIHKATAREPKARYESATALREAVASYLRHRSAIALTRESLILLDTLEQTLARHRNGSSASGGEDEAAAETAQRVIFEQFTRCHTSFNLALRGWPENPRATEGLQACLEAMIEYGLDEGLAPLVGSLIPQLPQARPSLEQRAQALQRTLKDALEADAKLRAIQHDQNIFLSPGAKRVVVGFYVLFSLVVGLWIHHNFRDGPGWVDLTLRPIHGVYFSAGFVAVGIIVVTIAWRWLSKNQITRRTAVTFVAVGSLCVANRFLLWTTDTPVIEMVRQDCMTMAAVLVAAGVLLHWWFVVPAALLLGGMVSIALWPGWYPTIFTLSFSTALAVACAPLFSERLKRLCALTPTTPLSANPSAPTGVDP